MPFAASPHDTHTLGVMTAALEAAWMAANLGIAGLTHADRAKMERGILIAAAFGERDFKQLQQAAFDALGATTLEPVDRRERLRLVATDRRRR